MNLQGGKKYHLGITDLIPVNVFEKEGISYDEAMLIINNLGCVETENGKLRRIHGKRVRLPNDESLQSGIELFSDVELKENFALDVKDWKELEETKKQIDEKIEEEKSKTSRREESQKGFPLLTKDLKADAVAGKLFAYSDGTIRYDGEILKLRPQIKELCRYFMLNQRMLKTIDDVKENIIRSSKRKTTPNSTIAKYVSELRNSLNPYFKKDVFPNEKEEGWYFEP